MRSWTGFTLVQLVLTLVLLGLIAYFAVPRHGAIVEVRGRAALVKLCEDIRYAQSVAMAGGGFTGVQFLTGAPNEYLVFKTDPSNLITDPWTRQPFRFTFNQQRMAGVELTSVSGLGSDPADRVLFNSLGRPFKSEGGTNIPLTEPATVLLRPCSPSIA